MDRLTDKRWRSWPIRLTDEERAAMKASTPNDDANDISTGERQGVIEAIVGPCSRRRLEEALEFVQEALDERFPDLAAALCGQYWLDERPAARGSVSLPNDGLTRTEAQAVCDLLDGQYAVLSREARAKLRRMAG